MQPDLAIKGHVRVLQPNPGTNDLLVPDVCRGQLQDVDALIDMGMIDNSTFVFIDQAWLLKRTCHVTGILSCHQLFTSLPSPPPLSLDFSTHTHVHVKMH